MTRKANRRDAGGNPDCAAIRARVFHLLDGRMTAARARSLRRHLALCPACFSRVEFARALRRMLKARVLSEQCPKALWAKVRGALRAAAAGRARGKIRPARA